MAQTHCTILKAELYLQAVHTRTTQLSTDEQIRDLVVLAHSLIATRSDTAQTGWAKSDGVVNSLLQTSEHLQQEQDIMTAKNINNASKGASSVDAKHHGDTVHDGKSSLPNTQCASEQYNLDSGTTHGMKHNKAVNSGGGGGGGGGGQEEIGDIEWEAMVASDVNFEDVVGCTSAIDAIRESVVIPMQFPSLFKRLNVKRSNGIMLYGPPGTGKSMIARATASEVNACFFNASCAELTSRWVGGSEKKLQSLFAAAVRNSPCIIFFDEVDSIACKREGDGSIADQRLTNQLLIELDKIFLAQNEVFVIAATNLPWQIDLAVMRRFPHTVYIELPNLDSRKRMFRSFFKTDVYSDDNIHELAQLSEHMSGSDIANVVNSILFEPIRILCRATHFSVSIMPPEILCSHDTPHCSVGVDEQNPTIHTQNPADGRVRRITVASDAQVHAFKARNKLNAHKDNGEILESSLSQVVAQYGENCIAMPPIDFHSICTKVRAFRYTVSHEYVQQYVKFHDQCV